MIHLEQLVQRWIAERSCVLPPASPAQVVAAFGAVGCKPTADVIRLYGYCGGMEQMDDAMWRLWPLDEIVRENAVAGEWGILFGDYLISPWCYRLRPVNADTSAVCLDYFNGAEPFQVAPTLEGFVEALWRNPDEVLEPQREERNPREP